MLEKLADVVGIFVLGFLVLSIGIVIGAGIERGATTIPYQGCDRIDRQVQTTVQQDSVVVTDVYIIIHCQEKRVFP